MTLNSNTYAQCVILNSSFFLKIGKKTTKNAYIFFLDKNPVHLH